MKCFSRIHLQIQLIIRTNYDQQKIIIRNNLFTKLFIWSFGKKMYKQIKQQKFDILCKEFNYKSINMKFLLYLALMTIVFAEFGVDVAFLVSTENYQCMKNSGISFAIPRAYKDDGSIDPNAIFSLSNAKSAGLYTDIYMMPCRGNNATTQVNEMMNGIPSSLYGMVWIFLLQNDSPGCSWAGHDANSNCAFVTELVNAVKARGKNAGIYTYYLEYSAIMGNPFACPALGTQPLFYTYTPSNPDFFDWNFFKFGPWTTPRYKQYQLKSPLCGVDVNRIFG